MNNKKKNNAEIESAFEDAFSDLLSISNGKNVHANEIKVKYAKSTRPSVEENLKTDSSRKITFSEILDEAKKANLENSKHTWVDPKIEEENLRLEELKKQGKGAYDSDVLRERILRRQAEKRQNLIMDMNIKKDED